MASVLAPVLGVFVLGVFDGRFVVPAAAAGNFGDARDVDDGLGLGTAGSEIRTAPDGELVDLRRSLMEAGIHRVLSC
jgi:hypothetical protein